MNSIRKKLNNNSGSSIMLALGLLLICTMISTVVVTMAAAGSSRHTKKRVEQQREYLSISSAAQTVMQEIEKIEKYEGKEMDLDYACNDYCNGFPESARTSASYLLEGGEEIPSGWGLSTDVSSLLGKTEVRDVLLSHDFNISAHMDEEDKIISNSTQPEGALADMVDKGMETIYWNKTAESYEKTFQISTSDERVKTVNGKFMMDKDYDITVELTIGSTYAITITAKANTEEGNTQESLACSHTLYYNYYDGDAFKSAKDTGVSIVGTKDIRTINVTWDEPKLMRVR